jgi:hypothetical protein
MNTDEGLPFLFSEIPDLGQLFIFFDIQDFCNSYVIYPLNTEVTAAIVSSFNEQFQKLAENVWLSNATDGAERISLEVDENGKQLFVFIPPQ